MDYILSAITDIGIKKDTNQDSYYAMVADTAWGKIAFAIVCDGMGGLQRGEVASNSLVQAFKRWVKDYLHSLASPPLSEEIQNGWMSLVEAYNQKINSYGQRESIRLGTTCTVLMLYEGQYYILNVGDTRCYCLSESMQLLTHDHSLVQQEVDQGILSLEAAAHDSRRNVLLQCVGASARLNPDFFEGSFAPGSSFCLCTDGFRHAVSEEEMMTWLAPGVAAEEQVMQWHLAELVELNKQRGETDNITGLLVKAV